MLLIRRTLTGTTISDLIGPGSIDNERVMKISKLSRTGASLQDSIQSHKDNNLFLKIWVLAHRHRYSQRNLSPADRTVTPNVGAYAPPVGHGNILMEYTIF